MPSWLAPGGEVVRPEGGSDLDRHLEDLRCRFMAEGLDRCGGIQTRAAELLGMTFRSFRYFAKKYGLTGREAAVPEGETTPAAAWD